MFYFVNYCIPSWLCFILLVSFAECVRELSAVVCATAVEIVCESFFEIFTELFLHMNFLVFRKSAQCLSRPCDLTCVCVCVCVYIFSLKSHQLASRLLERIVA